MACVALTLKQGGNLLPKLGIADPLAIAAVSLPASMLAAVAFWRIVEVPSMNLSRSLASR